MTNFGVKAAAAGDGVAKFLYQNAYMKLDDNDDVIDQAVLNALAGNWAEEETAFFFDLNRFSTSLFVSGPVSASGKLFGSGNFVHTTAAAGSASSSAGVISSIPVTAVGFSIDLSVKQLFAMATNKTSFCFGFVNLSVTQNTANPSDSIWFRFDIEKTRVAYSVYTSSGNGTIGNPIVPSAALPPVGQVLNTGFLTFSDAVNQLASFSFSWDGYRTYIGKYGTQLISTIYDGIDFSSGTYFPFFVMLESSGNYFGVDKLTAGPAKDGVRIVGSNIGLKGVSQAFLSANDLTTHKMHFTQSLRTVYPFSAQSLVSSVELDYCPPDLSVPAGACPLGRVRVGSYWDSGGLDSVYSDSFSSPSYPTIRPIYLKHSQFSSGNSVGPTALNNFLDSCSQSGSIPYIMFQLVGWVGVDSSPYLLALDNFISALDQKTKSLNIPAWVSVERLPDLTSSFLSTWLSYQRHTRMLLNRRSADQIAFFPRFTAANIDAAIQSPTTAVIWESGIWDMCLMRLDSYSPSTFLNTNLSRLEWISARTSRMVIESNILQDDSAATPTSASNWASLYNYATTISGTSYGATPSLLPKVEGIINYTKNSTDFGSGAFLQELKNSVSNTGQYSRFTVNDGVKKRVFFADEFLTTTDRYVEYIKNFILESGASSMVFGGQRVIDNIASAQSNGYGNFNIWGASRYADATPISPIGFYVKVYKKLHNLPEFSSIPFFAPNFSLSPRGEGFDVSTNGALTDSRYVNYFTSFISELLFEPDSSGNNAIADALNVFGVAVSGNFSKQDWAKIIQHIRNNLSYKGVLMTVVEDKLGTPNIGSALTISGFRERNAVSEYLGVSDFCILPSGFIFLGEYGGSFSDWLFDGTLTVFDEVLNTKINIESYTESILSEGFVEVIDSTQATPFYFSADMPSSGGSISVGNLKPGTYKVLISGLVGADGDANLRISVSSSNFETIALSLSEHFTRGGL